MARTRVIIDVDKLYQHAYLQCSVREAARYFGVAKTTLDKKMIDEPRLRRYWDAGKQDGLNYLREQQFALASTSAPMGIFLGKNYLNQRDRHDLEHSGPDRKGIPHELSVADLKQLRDLARGNAPEAASVPAAGSASGVDDGAISREHNAHDVPGIGSTRTGTPVLPNDESPLDLDVEAGVDPLDDDE